MGVRGARSTSAGSVHRHEAHATPQKTRPHSPSASRRAERATVTPEVEARFRRAREHGLAGPDPAGAGAQPTSGYHWLDLRAGQPSPFVENETYEIGGRQLRGAALEEMRQDWLRLVLKRRLTSKAFRRRHHIDLETLNALKRAYPEDFTWQARRPARVFAADVVQSAQTLIEAYHAGAFSYLELKCELRALGIEDWQHANLEKQLPEGMHLARRSASVYQQQRRDHFNAVADAMEALLEAHGWVVGKQTDLLEVLNADAAFRAAFPPQTRDGKYNGAWLGKLRRQDLKEADGRIAEIFDRVKPEGKRGRLQPARGGHERPALDPASKGASALRGPNRSDTLDIRGQLKILARMLAGKEPSEERLRAVLAAFAKTTGVKRPYRLWRLMMEQYKGVIPELARWRVGAKNEYPLRYLARFVAATHAAGPAATEKQVAAVFEKSVEFAEDSRLPDTKLFSKVKQDSELGWDMAVVRRARFQLLRNLLEAVRIAPPDLDLKHILAETKIRPQFANYEDVTYYLNDALKGGKWAEGQDARLLRAISSRSSRFICGLGEKRDARYDPNAEPPWFPLRLAEKLLSIPRVEDSELFLHAIDRLDGRLPFENNHMMVVYHRYSDILPLLDLFVRAGMSPANSLFVSTPYPFDPAFDVQLRDLGITQVPFPPCDEPAFHDAVAKGLRRMIKAYDARKKKHGYGRPILILDDGGMAADIIRTEFKAHAHKFKVVEVTAAGHRITADLKREHLRVPFVYYSIAYSDFKRKVTSEFYARRVVDRTVNFSDVTDVKPINHRVAIIGGGPMGSFAAKHWKRLGYEVAIVEKDPKVRAELLADGFAESEVYTDTRMKAALQGRGIVQSMCGFKNVIGPAHLDWLEDGAIVLHGASKRNDLDMDGFTRLAKKKIEIPRRDDLPQKAYTYTFGKGAEAKSLHFPGDGWTMNHDGSLHGTPFDEVQLETVLIFESAVEAASDRTTDTGDLKVVGGEVQEEYVSLWKHRHKGRRRTR